MPNLTDLSTIRDLCARHDFALSKGFGQNFIVNPGVCPKIVEAAGIDENWGVLEIGPGIGVLTKELALRAKRWWRWRWTSACPLCWRKRWRNLTVWKLCFRIY